MGFILHAFRIPSAKTLIGIPDGELDEGYLPSWEIPLSRFLKEPGEEGHYDYDFGDGWHHKVILEGILLHFGIHTK